MLLAPGKTCVSAVDDTTVIVVRAAQAEVELTCGGVAMTTPEEATEKVAAQPGHDGSALLGKRYVNAADTIEVLCTKAGASALAVDGEVLEIKAARPLPASD